MLLRSITKHVKEQNWFAVFVDFLIVVVGILIAFQITNWSEQKSARNDYDLAIERYKAEIDANLEALDTLDAESSEVLLQVNTAFDVLLACKDNAENRDLVDRGLNRALGTFGLTLRNSALRELTETQHLLAQQSELERQKFADIKYLMDVFLSEAEYLETIPLVQRLQDNPIISIGASEQRFVEYSGVDYSRKVRKMKLNLPLDQACQDNALIKSIYTWDRWQGAMPAVTRVLRAEFKTMQDWLEK